MARKQKSRKPRSVQASPYPAASRSSPARRQLSTYDAGSAGEPRRAATQLASIPLLQRQATSLYQAGRLRQALGICRQILVRQPDRADVLGFAGMIAMELGDDRKAVKLYRTAIARKPDYVEAHYNLGNALKNLGEPDEAITVYRRAVDIEPGLAPAHHNLGNALHSLGRLDEAAAAYRRVLAIMPDAAETHRNLGIVLQELGHREDAAAAFRCALAFKPDWPLANSNLLNVLLELGDSQAVLEASDEWLRLSPGTTEALALKCLALNELGRRELLRDLLDFDRFVRITHVDVPVGYASLADFNSALARHICAHPTLKTPPEDDPTYHHPSLQITEELLVEPKGPVADLEQAISRAVAEYREVISGDSGHPFVATWPQRWRLSSWGVVLDGQGNLVPHIHLDGYLGGVYYVQLPEVVTATRSDKAEWFELGRPPDDLNCTAAPEVHAVQPAEGRMLLFPSYMYHGTLPFESS